MDYQLKKSLGQHFLKDESVCEKIINSLNVSSIKNLLEVGPGGGALTKYLLKFNHLNFKAVEIDLEKITFLENKYPSILGKIISSDVLKMEMPFNENFTVIGNFPYNISTQIVFKIIDWRNHVDGVVGMFQKEVADRLCSTSGSKVYGVSSVLTQMFFDVSFVLDVPPSAFNPPPKVNSSVIKLTPKKQKIEIASPEKLFKVVKAAFNQRRKMLRNGLKGLLTTEELSKEIYTKRAEDLTIEQFAALTFLLPL